MTSKKTSIQVAVTTKNRLNKIGSRGETYDTIINRLPDRRKKDIK